MTACGKEGLPLINESEWCSGTNKKRSERLGGMTVGILIGHVTRQDWASEPKVGHLHSSYIRLYSLPIDRLINRDPTHPRRARHVEDYEPGTGLAVPEVRPPAWHAAQAPGATVARAM